MTQKPAPWQKLGLNLKMGLRACDEAHWLPLDDLFDDDTARGRQLSAKADLLDHRHEDVFSALLRKMRKALPFSSLPGMIHQSMQSHRHVVSCQC